MDEPFVCVQVRAAAAGHADCVSLLLHHTPELSVYLLDACYESGPLKGHNALSVAARNGHSRVVGTLLTEEPIPDVHSGPYHGAALLEAAAQGHGHVVDILLQQGCDADCHLATGRKSALHGAAASQQWPVCAVLIHSLLAATCLCCTCHRHAACTPSFSAECTPFRCFTFLYSMRVFDDVWAGQVWAQCLRERLRPLGPADLAT